ncbi:putative IGR protein [Helianthus annuus]|nr:putative IGR protein [Helianthus annuus]KAJ0651655.1 putative IGR protein [Helianthus annuus]
MVINNLKVGIPEFLNGIGNGVETYAEKLESEFGDLQNLLVARSMKLKKINVGGDPKVCKHFLLHYVECHLFCVCHCIMYKN